MCVRCEAVQMNLPFSAGEIESLLVAKRKIPSHSFLFVLLYFSLSHIHLFLIFISRTEGEKKERKSTHTLLQLVRRRSL